jgi:hypothetical protein
MRGFVRFTLLYELPSNGEIENEPPHARDRIGCFAYAIEIIQKLR